MKVIDIHTHTFPEKVAASAIEQLKAKSHTVAFTDGTITMLAESMASAGISYSVIQPVATSARQVIHVNDSSIRINNDYKNTGIISFGCMHPDFEGWHSELKRISDSGIKGIKLHPIYQGVSIDDKRYLRIIERAGELGLVVMIHAGWDIGFPGNENSMPEKISRVLGRAKIILAHMGGWRCWQEAEELFSGREGVYIDTAFSLGRFTPENDGYYTKPEQCELLSDDEFLRMIKSFGAEHVLFGTDSPWSSQAEDVKAIYELPLSEREKSMIFYDNAAKLCL